MLRHANEYKTDGEITYIYLSQEQVTIIDTEDRDRVLERRWHAKWNPNASQFYVQNSERIDGKTVSTKLHAFLLGVPKGTIIDHIDNDGLNNRKSNLRTATVPQNAQNRKGPNITSSTGIRGVHHNTKSGKYVVKIGINNERIWGGYFPYTPEGLAAATARAAELYAQYHGGAL